MIEIYSLPTCYFCIQSKKIFEEKGVQYKEIMVGSDITREQFFERFPGIKTVPQIVIGGERVGGHEQLLEWMEHNDLRNFLSH